MESDAVPYRSMKEELRSVIILLPLSSREYHGVSLMITVPSLFTHRSASANVAT
jgi:creatinine amidohydrolase/Fe(II)-dependent formamide hydrolase-like protein